MTDHQHTADVLNRAADHICMFGHTKGVFCGPGPRMTAPACANGAITNAVFDGETVDRRMALRARLALREHVGVYSISRWNDEDERTAEEVVEALRAAAVIELSKAETPAPVTA